MGIFKNRPLAVILCIITCGFIFYTAASAIAKSVLAIIATALLASSFFVSPLKSIKVKICILCLTLSFIFSFLYFDLIFYPDDIYSEEVNVSATVTDVEKTDYGYSLDVNAHSVNNERHVNYKLKIYLYSQNVAPKAGDTVHFKARLREFESEGAFNFKQYYTARGYRASANVYALDITNSSAPAPISYKLAESRRSICRSFIETLGEHEGGFLSALLLGERDLMSDRLRLDFMRTGITHILALSGMHLVILTAALESLLRILGVGKRKRILCSIVFVVIFMALTGFPSSVCRAGIMLIISNVVYLIFGCKDHVTSLFIALTLILSAEPYAALDSGLWLSCLATFGILCASDIYSNKTFSKHKSINAIISYGIVSLFAVCATFALSVMLFDGFSFVSPLMTYVFGFLTEIYMYAGIAVFLLAHVFPAITAPFSHFYGFIASVCGIASEKIPYVYTSTDILPIQIGAVIITVILLLLVLLNSKRQNLLVIALACTYVITSVISVGVAAMDIDKDKIIYTCEDNDIFLINSAGVTSLIQASYSLTTDEAYSTLNFASQERIMQMDNLVITGIGQGVPHYVKNVISGIKVETLVLPLPQSDDEAAIIEQTYKIAVDFGISLKFFESTSPYSLGNIDFVSVFTPQLGKTYSKIFILKSGNDLYSYVSEMDFYENKEAYTILHTSTHVIVGGGPYGNGMRYISSVSDKLRSIILTSDHIIVSDDASRNIDLIVKPKRALLYKN